MSDLYLKIPPATSGEYEIRNYVLENDIYPGGWQNPSRMLAGDQFVGLYQNGRVWMSNSPDEKRSCRPGLPEDTRHNPAANILIGGLGLGFVICYLDGMMHLPYVKDFKIANLTVVELSEDVINLVAPTYSALPYVNIVQGNIREYGKTGPKNFFDFAFIDIWGDVSTDDIKDMQSVRRGLRRVMKPGTCRVTCWYEDRLKYMKSRGGYY